MENKEVLSIKALANECKMWANHFRSVNEFEKEEYWLNAQQGYLNQLPKYTTNEPTK